MRAQRLVPTRHAAYRLGADLLLVFKPRGHAEDEHAHPYRQRLRILRGRLEVRTRARATVIDDASPALSLPAGRRHATRALSDVWLLAESRRGRSGRGPEARRP